MPPCAQDEPQYESDAGAGQCEPHGRPETAHNLHRLSFPSDEQPSYSIRWSVLMPDDHFALAGGEDTYASRCDRPEVRPR